MRRTHAGGANLDGPFDGVASSAQVGDPKRQGPSHAEHVLEEDEPGLDFANNSDCFGPQSIGASTAAGRERVWLAGNSRRNEIHRSTPGSPVEGSHVGPDRKRLKVSVVLALHENPPAVVVDLDGAHGSPSEQS